MFGASCGRRFGLATVAALLALLALPGLLGAGDGWAAARGAAATIRVGDDFFSPASKSIAKGDLLRFKWVGDHSHNVRKKRGPGGEFDSGFTAAEGVNFRKRFRRPGTYRLVCDLHDEMRMTVNVH